MTKEFIFMPGFWLGEGKITFTASNEFIKFYTKWNILEVEGGVIKATQVVEMQGIDEHMINQFTFKDISADHFIVILENDVIEKIEGKGLRDQKKNLLAWEFVGHSSFEGFDSYEKQENGDYFLHGEYGTSEDYRTIIEGLIWFKGS